MKMTKPPRSPLSKSEPRFTSQNMARFFNEDGLFLEIWVGAETTSIRYLFERRGEEMPQI